MHFFVYFVAYIVNKLYICSVNKYLNIMGTKLKVRVKFANPDSTIKKGDVGEVESYLMMNDNFPVAVVVFGCKIRTYPLPWLEVVTDEQLMKKTLSRKEQYEMLIKPEGMESEEEEF